MIGFSLYLESILSCQNFKAKLNKSLFLKNILRNYAHNIIARINIFNPKKIQTIILNKFHYYYFSRKMSCSEKKVSLRKWPKKKIFPQLFQDQAIPFDRGSNPIK